VLSIPGKGGRLERDKGRAQQTETPTLAADSITGVPSPRTSLCRQDEETPADTSLVPDRSPRPGTATGGRAGEWETALSVRRPRARSSNSLPAGNWFPPASGGVFAPTTDLNRARWVSRAGSGQPPPSAAARGQHERVGVALLSGTSALHPEGDGRDRERLRPRAGLAGARRRHPRRGSDRNPPTPRTWKFGRQTVYSGKHGHVSGKLRSGVTVHDRGWLGRA